MTDKKDVHTVIVGMPFYNNESTLELAIQSVVRQTYSRWKLILVNDGSTDRSLEIARRYQNRFTKISVIDGKSNRGLIYRLNQIIDLSDDEFICRMDADDVMMPERLERQIAILKENPEIQVVSSGIYVVNENLVPTGKRNVEQLREISKKDLLKRSILAHPTVMARTGWYKSNKYNAKYKRAEDFELWLRTFDRKKFYNIPEPLLVYREGNVNVANYLETTSTLKSIIADYGHLYLTTTEQKIEVWKLNGKALVYSIFGYLALQFILTRRRNSEIDGKEFSQVTSIISSLLNDIKQQAI